MLAEGSGGEQPGELEVGMVSGSWGQGCLQSRRGLSKVTEPQLGGRYGIVTNLEEVGFVLGVWHCFLAWVSGGRGGGGRCGLAFGVFDMRGVYKQRVSKPQVQDSHARTSTGNEQKWIHR